MTEPRKEAACAYWKRKEFARLSVEGQRERESARQWACERVREGSKAHVEKARLHGVVVNEGRHNTLDLFRTQLIPTCTHKHKSHTSHTHTHHTKHITPHITTYITYLLCCLQNPRQEDSSSKIGSFGEFRTNNKKKTTITRPTVTLPVKRRVGD